jgi:hypothetical protein
MKSLHFFENHPSEEKKEILWQLLNNIISAEILRMIQYTIMAFLGGGHP